MAEVDGQFNTTMAIVKFITIVIESHEKWELGGIPQNDKGQENNETSLGNLTIGQMELHHFHLFMKLSRRPLFLYFQREGNKIECVSNRY